MSFSDHLSDFPATGQNIRYSGVNCVLGPSKSICYCEDFVMAGFITARFVSAYFTVIRPGFQMLFVITGSSLSRGATIQGTDKRVIL